MAYLDENVNDLARGLNLFAGIPKPANSGIPRQAVFVKESGGFLGIPYMGESKKFRRPFIEVTIRDDENNYARGGELAREVYQALDECVLDLPGFLWCRALESGPTFTGQGRDNNIEWYFTLEIGIDEAT